MVSYKTIECKKFKDFLEVITPWSSPYKLSNFVFRGLSDENYQLLPNSFRDKTHANIKNIARVDINDKHKFAKAMRAVGYGNIGIQHASMEFHILRRFYRKANSHGLYVPRSKFMSHAMEKEFVGLEALMRLYGYDTWLDRDFVEIASLAQHYGLPTRLIDWSYNPYTAAFFASNNIKKKADGKISLWMMDFTKLADVFDSNHSDIKIYNPHYQWNDNARSQFGLFTYKALNFNKETRGILNEFYTEITESGTIPKDDKFTPLYTSYETFDESVARLLKSYNLLKVREIKDEVMVKITLPHSEVDKLNKSLRAINISESSIFPGYSGVVSDMINKNSIL
ncbi:TPA: FRG domain-containing protein [Serratia marcescens]